MKLLRPLLAVTAFLVITTNAFASPLEVTVDARSGPWNWAAGGLNDNYRYGPSAQDFLAPTVINLASIGSGAGNNLFILYKSGLTSAFGGTPYVDQAGHVGSPFKDDALGSSGFPFPSFHMPGSWGVNQLNPQDNSPVSDPENYGIFLNGLVAALTDANGTVLNPFPVGYVIPVDDGNGGYTQGFVFGLSFGISDPNAVNLQLGFNDDLFADNTGSLQVCVGSSQADIDSCINGTVTVPEPSSVLLFAIGGLALIGAMPALKSRYRQL